jgi:hypothetical protein
MQGGDVVENLSVSKSGKTVRIAAGRYQVEVDGNFDGISVNGGEVSLKRGGVETVRIVRSADAPDSGVPQNQLPLAARKLAAELRNAQLRRKLLLETPVAANPEVLKLDAEIKTIEESIRRLKAVPEVIASSVVSVPDDGQLEKKVPMPGDSLTIPSARIVLLSNLQREGLVRLNQLGVEGDFDLGGRSLYEFVDAKAGIVVDDDRRTKTSLEGIVTFIDPQAKADGKIRIRVSVQNLHRDGKWLLNPGDLVKLTIHAVDPLSLSDIDAGPVWGEAVDGLQLGVRGIRQDRHFKSGDTIRFRLVVRNVGTQSVHYNPPNTRQWVAPYVERTNGERVELLPPSSDRGGHTLFTETLEPNAMVSVLVPGILVLGASDTAQKNWPRIEKPEPGEYKLRGGLMIRRMDFPGKPFGENSMLTSGTVTFHVDPAP